MTNLFAYRATEPKDMKAAEDPIGEENDNWLLKFYTDAGIVIAAWGNDGSFLGRSEQVRKLIPNLHCIKMNKTGEPAHPLYQRLDAVPIPMGK